VRTTNLTSTGVCLLKTNPNFSCITSVFPSSAKRILFCLN
jgi:hypothetical protein